MSRLSAVNGKARRRSSITSQASDSVKPYQLCDDGALHQPGVALETVLHVPCGGCHKSTVRLCPAQQPIHSTVSFKLLKWVAEDAPRDSASRREPAAGIVGEEISRRMSLAGADSFRTSALHSKLR